MLITMDDGVLDSGSIVGVIINGLTATLIGRPGVSHYTKRFATTEEAAGFYATVEPYISNHDDVERGDLRWFVTDNALVGLSEIARISPCDNCVQFWVAQPQPFMPSLYTKTCVSVEAALNLYRWICSKLRCLPEDTASG